MGERTAFLFPGQGSYSPGMLAGAVERRPATRSVLEVIDAVCVEQRFEPVSDMLMDPAGPTLEALVAERSESLDLVLFAGNVASYEVLLAEGMRPDVMAGHSFGELAALSAAGSVTVSDATRMVCERSVVLRGREPPAGGMVAVALDGRRAAHLAGLIDDPCLVLAVENSPDQCVMSGPPDHLAELEQIVKAMGVRATRLRAAYPFHNPLLRDAAEVIAAAVAEVPVASPRVPVYSSILGRYVVGESDVSALIRGHLTRPVLFYDGLLRLHRDGVRRFVEVSTRDTLTQFVRAALPNDVTTGSGFRLTQPAAEQSSGSAVPARRAGDAATPGAARLPSPRLPQESPAPASLPAGSRLPDEERLLGELRSAYAELLEVPEDLLADDVDLEADLGVDSLKQMETFEQLRRRYALADPPEDLRVTSFTTLPKIAELLRALDAAQGVPT